MKVQGRTGRGHNIEKVIAEEMRESREDRLTFI